MIQNRSDRINQKIKAMIHSLHQYHEKAPESDVGTGAGTRRAPYDEADESAREERLGQTAAWIVKPSEAQEISYTKPTAAYAQEESSVQRHSELRRTDL